MSEPTKQPAATLIASTPYLSAAILAAYLIAECKCPPITAETMHGIMAMPIDSPNVISLFKSESREFFRALGYSGDMREIMEAFQLDCATQLAILVAKNHYTLDKIGLTYCIIPRIKAEVSYYTLQDVIHKYREPGKTITNPHLANAMVECLKEVDPQLHALIVG